MSGSRNAAARASLGIPDNFRLYSAFPFSGMNQSASRIGMDDKEFFYLENFIRIGDGNLRTLWDAGPAFFTASQGKTILPYVVAFNIGSSQYFAVFYSDGTADQVAYPSGTVTPISAIVGLFYLAANGQLPVAMQSGTQYLIIANHNTDNDYWIWDGTLLYGAGSIAPTDAGTITDGGSGYTSVPSYTVYGGHGSGVVLTPVINEGSVVQLIVDNPGTGYLPGDVVQVAFSGGGSDTTPILEAVLASGVLQFVTLIAGGSGYPPGTYALGFSSGSATGTFTVSATGVVTSAALTSGGSSYTSTPSITFPIPGTGGAITAVGTSWPTAGPVTSLTISNGGSGYVPGTYPLTFTGTPGSGASATYTVNASGVIASTTLIAGGTGYTSAPTVGIPKGSGAAAVASITAGAVASVLFSPTMSFPYLSPGTNLTGTPTLSFVGGGGTGAAATVTVTGGAISGVTITNGGTGYTSAPAVEVETGTNNAAAAVLTLMPYGVSGTSIETYQTRVWISYPNQVGNEQNGGTFFVSAPDSLTDFATSDGGDIFTNIDRFLRRQYTLLRQTSNFLYAVGDSSVSVVSNVQTSGNPATTTFSYQNSDPQTGTPYRDTAQDYANTILLANQFGVFGIYGGSVRKVSGKIDEVFNSAVLPPAGGLVPTSAVANIYAQKVYLLLMTVVPPFLGAVKRNVMVMWNEKEWFIASQTPGLTAIGTQEIDSNLTAWGTDGKALYPLFNTPSTHNKILSTKMYGGADGFMIKSADAAYFDVVDRSAGQTGVAFSAATIDADGLAVPKIVERNGQQITLSCPSGAYAWETLPSFKAPYPFGAVWGGGVPQVPGIGLGMTITSQSLDFSIRNVSLAVVDYSALR